MHHVCKSVFAVGAAACLAAALAAPAAWGNPLPKRLTMASLAMGTSNNAMANALAKVASEKSGMLVVTRPASSASFWVNSTSAKGNPELGFAHILDVWWAFSGKLSPEALADQPYGDKPFYEKSPNLRMLVAGPRMRLGVLAPKDKDWKTIGDAKGSRLAGGFTAHAGAYAGLVGVLAAEGLHESRDFNMLPVPTANAGTTAMTEGRVELSMQTVGNSLVSEVNSRVGVRFLDVPHDPEALARIRKVFPGSDVQLYTGRGPGVEKDTWLLTYPMAVTASTHMPDEVAYALVKAWWENYEDTWNIHVACKGWDKTQFVLRDATIPYHPGAIRFFREQGVWDEQMDAVQAALVAGEYPFLKK